MHTLLRYLVLSIFFCLPAIAGLATPHANISNAPAWVLPRQPNLDKKPKSKEIDDGAYLLLYDEQVNVPAQARYRHFIKKIVNQSGVQANSELSFSFVADYQQINFHGISILRGGQRINKLNKSQIKIVNTESELSNHQLMGQYTAIVVLEDLRKEDVVEIDYTVTGFNPIYNNKYTDRFFFASSVPVVNHYTSILLPAGGTIHYKCHNEAPTPVVTNVGGYAVYDWPVMELEAYDYGENTPEWYIGSPYAEVTEYDNWTQVAWWALGIMNNYNYTIPPALQQKIDEWAKAGDASLFAKKAIHFVQDDIRYMGIEIGVNSHKPHTPAETFGKRYGDCKDKSVLLVAILRSQHIPAHAALVNTSLHDHLDEFLPSPSLFDHVIVRAMVDEKLLFIDPTIAMQGGAAGDIYIPNYGSALVVADDTRRPEIVRQNTHSSTTIVEVYDIPADNNTPARLKVETIYANGSADNMRAMFSRSSLKSIEEYFENYYRKTYSKVNLEDSVTYTDNSIDNRFTVHESYAIGDIWEKSRSDVDYVTVLARPVYECLTEPSKKSQDKPLAQGYPVNITYTAVLHMPQNWEFADKSFNLLRPGYSFRFDPYVDGNTVTLQYSFMTFKDHIPVEELEQYKEDYERIVAALQYSMTYDRKLIDKIGYINERGGAAKINWVAVFICLVCAAGTLLFLLRVNKQHSVLTSHTANPAPFNWWLILLGVVLFLRIGIYTYTFYSGEYFLTSSWIVMNEKGLSGLQLLWMVEISANAFFLVYACMLTYWFIGRRDIFPRVFIIFAIAEAVYSLVVLVLATAFRTEVESIYPDYLGQASRDIGRSLFFLIIWGSAIHRSYAAKSTFVKPYKYRVKEAADIIAYPPAAPSLPQREDEAGSE